MKSRTQTVHTSYVGFKAASPRASAAARGSSKKKNTACELVLRKALSALGLRYHIDAVDLPGRPDVVFRPARVAVYCDGDFWHGRNFEQRIAKLSTGHNAPYWVAKIQGNVARDTRTAAALEADGWMVLRFWEKDIHADAERIATEIAQHVRERRALRK
jgi:DNA mismatch endonuclease (patch repair protein)